MDTTGGDHIPEDCKPENFQALIDAVNEYGRYTDGPAPMPEEAYNQDKNLNSLQLKMLLLLGICIEMTTAGK